MPVRLGRPGSELAAAGRGDGVLPVTGRHAGHDRQCVVLAQLALGVDAPGEGGRQRGAAEAERDAARERGQQHDHQPGA